MRANPRASAIGVAGFVHINPFDPVLKFASTVALGVACLAGAAIFFTAALTSKTQA
ncbi:MAG TPA: hypothetical protein VJS47_08840 [Rhizomicrobium sp.]|nr:hypothetical protein [Rhizomicrobium sp.]